MSEPATRRRAALLAAVPVAAPVGVFGISYGVLAAAAGIPGWQAALASLTVFAGSSQFAAVSVLAAGGTPIAAIASGVLLNARYLATGAAVAPVLTGPRWKRALQAQLVVDESFAVGVAVGGPGRPPDRTALLVSGVTLYLSWFAGTVIGVVVGDVVGDPRRLGLDAAFPALFVALLWSLLRSRRAWATAAAGGAVALASAPFTPRGVPLALAAVAGLLVAGRGSDADAADDADDADDSDDSDDAYDGQNHRGDRDDRDDTTALANRDDRNERDDRNDTTGLANRDERDDN